MHRLRSSAALVDQVASGNLGPLESGPKRAQAFESDLAPCLPVAIDRRQLGNGFPVASVTMVLPLSASSTRAEKWVFASKIPIDFIHTSLARLV